MCSDSLIKAIRVRPRVLTHLMWHTELYTDHHPHTDACGLCKYAAACAKGPASC